MLRRRTACWALATCALLSCQRPATEIVVRFRTNMSQGSTGTLTNVDVRVEANTQPWFENQFPIGDTPAQQLPQELGLRPRDGSALTHPVTVIVTPMHLQQRLFTYRAIASYEPDHVGLLEIFLADQCIGVVCDPSETCTLNGCVPVVNQTTLPPYMPLDASVTDAMEAGVDADAGAADASDIVEASDAADGVVLGDAPIADTASDVDAARDVPPTDGLDAPSDAADVTDVSDVMGVVDVVDVVDVADATDATDGATLVAIRPLAPASTGYVTNHRPTFRFVLPAGATNALVDVCADRACATPLVGPLVATGSTARPTSDLPAGVGYWRVRATGALNSATWEFVVGVRSTPTDASWGSLLDVNGDAFADVVVGSLNANAIYVYHGGPSWIPTAASATINGPTMANLGRVVAGAGDVNGDGFADVVASAPAGMAGVAPAAHLFAGSASGLSATPLSIVSVAGASGFAYSVAGAGDVNGDGYADVLVGADGASTAYLFLGGATGLTAAPALTLSGPTAYGHAVAGIGDINADGYADFAVGSDMSAVVNVFAGGATLSTVPLVMLAGPARSNFGYAVATAGDLDANGYPDLTVGANVSDSVMVFYTPASPMPFPTTATVTLAGVSGSSFGHAATTAHDVDHDGYDDLLVSADVGNTAYVYRGQATPIATTATTTLLGAMSSTFGYGAVGAGDVNRDGFADVVIGADNIPQVYVYAGSATGLSTTAAVTLNGPTHSYFGETVAWRRSASAWLRL